MIPSLDRAGFALVSLSIPAPRAQRSVCQLVLWHTMHEDLTRVVGSAESTMQRKARYILSFFQELKKYPYVTTGENYFNQLLLELFFIKSIWNFYFDNIDI